MEIEHINENTIRVVIQSQDLADRGVTFLDLLGNHQETENFFYSILEEVDIDDEFRSSEAVTFQVLPKGDGLELFITKNPPIADINNIDMENSEELTNLLKQHVADQLQEDEELILTADDFEEVKLQDRYVFEVADFDQFIQMAKEVTLSSNEATIYHYRHQYFLDLLFVEDAILADHDNDIFVLSEYAQESRVTPEILAEHGKVILKNNALEQLNELF